MKTGNMPNTEGINTKVNVPSSPPTKSKPAPMGNMPFGKDKGVIDGKVSV